MIGTTLGHFRIVAKLAESAGGEVYRAEDEALRRQVALEVLSPALASDPGHKARFLSAARAAAAVTHPNLAAIHEVGESDGRVWVAMELVEGDTLRSRLRGRPLPLLETLRIGEQVAQGLAAAHDKGLRHGNLQAAKVLLGPGGQVKVVDLGLGVGRSAEPDDTRTDVFRLGAMLYEMATGEAPRAEADIDSDGKDGHAAAATSPPSTLNPGVPADLDRIIAACLEPDPDDRYQHAGEIATDLERLRRRTETAAVAAPGRAMTARPRTPWAGRRIAFWSAAVVILAASVALAGWRWVRPLVRPAPPFKEGDRILVADFVNETNDIELGLAVREAARSLIWGYTTLVEVPREVEQEVVALDAAAAEARCLKGECEGVLTGRLAGNEGRYVVEIALHRAGSGTPVVEVTAETDGRTIADRIEAMLGEAARALQQKSGVGKSPGATWGSCGVRGSGAAALKSARLGGRADAKAETGDLAAALTLYKMALDLDPDNQAARWNFGLYLFFSNSGRRSEALPQLKLAAQQMVAAAEKRPGCRWNALTNEVWYLDMSWGYDDLAERVNRGVQLFPDHSGMWLKYGLITERAMGDPAAATPYYRKAYETSKSTFGGSFFYVFAYHLLRAGKLDEVDAVIEDYRGLPAESEAVTEERGKGIEGIRLRKAYIRGDDYGVLLEALERMVRDGVLTKEEARADRAAWLSMAGRLAEAESLALEERDQATTTAMSSGTQRGGGYDFLDWLEVRRTGKARVLESAERDNALWGDEKLNDLARMSVELSSAEALKVVLRTVEQEQKDNRNHRVQDAIRFSRGCVALIDGRAAEAVDLLEPLARDNGPASFLGPQHVLGRAYEAAGRWADAAQAYESVLAERRFWVFRKEPGVIYVLEQHRLAGIYERLGNSERARYWYGRFLHDWRNADPGTPEVEDAKKRLAALGGPLPAGAS